jgi:hypothetical protein
MIPTRTRRTDDLRTRNSAPGSAWPGSTRGRATIGLATGTGIDPEAITEIVAAVGFWSGSTLIFYSQPPSLESN